MTDRLSNQMGDGTDAVREFVRRALVTGTAVTMPLIVTLIVLGFVVDFVSQQLDPVVGFVTATIGFAPASDFVLSSRRSSRWSRWSSSSAWRRSTGRARPTWASSSRRSSPASPASGRCTGASTK
ncbi:hypothetical protein ACFQH8_04865 [Halomicroarcula sp. GCM10025710]